jgi:hypothetical protein
MCNFNVRFRVMGFGFAFALQPVRHVQRHERQVLRGQQFGDAYALPHAARVREPVQEHNWNAKSEATDCSALVTSHIQCFLRQNT